MLKILPLVTGLALALVASTALAGDAPSRRGSRTDLLASHRQAAVDLDVQRTDGRERLGSDRVVLGRIDVPVVQQPDVPVLFGDDEAMSVSKASVMDAEGGVRRANRGSWVIDGIRIDQDPAGQLAFENRANRRMPALVAHGIDSDGTERVFQLR